jgi:hypothetical protein
VNIDLSVIVMTDDGVPGLSDYRKNVLQKAMNYETYDFTLTKVEDQPLTAINSANLEVSCTKDEW